MKPPFPHQIEGADFLVGTARALLIDECGLGKTRQYIMMADQLGLMDCLVVCPNAVTTVWQEEIADFSTAPDTVIIRGYPKDRARQFKQSARFHVISYDLARRHEADLLRRWQSIVYDEAHRVKNYSPGKWSSLQGRVLKHVSSWSSRLVMMTGTPIANRPPDLWALLNMLYPKDFGSYWKFVYEYCHVWSNGFGLVVGDLRKEKAELLRQVLAPFTLKRTKQEVFPDMPKKTITAITITMTDEHRRLYRSMSEDAYVRIDDKTIAAPVVLAQITRLRQIAVSPWLLNETRDKPIWGSKIPVLLDLIEDAGDQKVVVFSQFSTAIRGLKTLLDDKFPEAFSTTFTGDDSAEEQTEHRTRFKEDPRCRVLLATIGAGSEGQTFTAGSICIFLDQAFDPKSNFQAMDRLDRIGQTRPVTVYVLLLEGTIDEEIALAFKSKADQIESVTGSQLIEEIRKIRFKRTSSPAVARPPLR